MRKATRGFTLVELLIALSIASFISMLLFSGLRLGIDVGTSVDAQLEAIEAVHLTQTYLRRQLQQMQPLTDPEAARIEFSGEPRAVEFVAAFTAARRADRFYRFSITVSEGLAGDPHAGQLSLSYAADAGGGGAEQPLILADGLASAEFAYFGPSGWQAHWTDAEELPALIRLRVEPREGSPWPDLVVAPKLGRAAAK